MTESERRAHAQRLAQLRRQREEEERRRHAEAAARARAIWDAATPATDGHSYLTRKQVKAHGLRVHEDGRLIVPLRDANGLLTSLEFIDDTGQKKFLAGARVAGCFHLLGNAADVICIAEGYATAASVHEATGYPVAVAFSAGNLLAVAQSLRARYPNATIIVCGDNDANGVGQTKAKDAAEAVGGVAVIPDTAGADWNDIHVQRGIEAVREGIMPAFDQAADGKPADGPYRVEGGRIVRVKLTKDGPVTEALCNFRAEVTEEIALDDGAEVTRAFQVEGRLDSGETLPPVRVGASKFASMTWVQEGWGLKAIVRAGSATKDYLREAIQRLSHDAVQRHVFTHTGWRDIDGRFIYLTAAGAIGDARNRYEVDLSDELARYRIPPVADDPKTAMQDSLRLLRIAPLSVTAPLWAATFRAPLASALPVDLSIWVEGVTGSLKSTLAALFLSHYGDFERIHLTQWSSTVNLLERRAFLLKDAVLVIDDWAPSYLDQRELEMKAARLLRAQGNLAGRGRLRADLSERPTYHPRGLIIATGEQHPPGQSVLARILVTELSRDMVDKHLLTEMQRAKSMLAHAMSGYLTWLAPQMPSLPAQLKATFEGARERASLNGEHLRVPEALAHMWIGLHTGLTYATEIGAISAGEANELQDAGWSALCEVGKRQGKLVEEQRPTLRFLTVLATLLTTNKVKICSKDFASEDESKTDLIGWYDSDYLYLIPDASYRVVATFCRETGQPFTASADRIKQDLWKEGLSESGEEGRHTVNIRLRSKTKRVLKLSRTAVEQVIEQDFPVPDVPAL